jgi:hypothetical protein
VRDARCTLNNVPHLAYQRVGGRAWAALASPSGGAVVRILAELEALESRVVVPGHGPVAGPSAIATMVAYIRDLEDIATRPGEPDQPRAYADWSYGELFAANVDFLRSRITA